MPKMRWPFFHHKGFTPSYTTPADSTYGDKVKKYEARVRMVLELGVEPREKDLKKLYYYLGRAEKKRYDHRTKFKDDVHWVKKKVGKNAGKLVETAARALLMKGL